MAMSWADRFGVGQCRRDHGVVLGVDVGLGREDHAGGRAGGDLGLAVVGELPVFDHAGACRVGGVPGLAGRADRVPDGLVRVVDELFEDVHLILRVGRGRVEHGSFDDAVEVARTGSRAVDADLDAHEDRAGVLQRLARHGDAVRGRGDAEHCRHAHAVAQPAAGTGVVGERDGDAGGVGDGGAVVGEFDGDGAAVDVAGVEAYVCDVAVG